MWNKHTRDIFSTYPTILISSFHLLFYATFHIFPIFLSYILLLVIYHMPHSETLYLQWFLDPELNEFLQKINLVSFYDDSFDRNEMTFMNKPLFITIQIEYCTWFITTKMLRHKKIICTSLCSAWARICPRRKCGTKQLAPHLKNCKDSLICFAFTFSLNGAER